MSYCVYSASDTTIDHLGRAHINLRLRNGFSGGPDGPGTFDPAASLRFNTTFYGKAAQWANDFEDLYYNWIGLVDMDWVGHIGCYGHCTENNGSMHHYGRALDLARVQMNDGWFVDMNWSWRQGLMHRRRYLAVAVYLRRYVKTVLTHQYNSDHADHIHFDDGETLAPISNTSKADTQLIQMACNMQNGESLGVDGVWDDTTEAAFQRLKTKMQLGCLNIRSNLDDTKVFLGLVAYDAASNYDAGQVTWGVC
jgi:hypothetical protein